jgi:hypothetical protein
VACAPEAEKEIVKHFESHGFAGARNIGTLGAGKPGIRVV